MILGLSLTLSAIALAVRRAFSPSLLFAANEPGVWYDPSDMSTLFQDAAGTAPVTAVGQPVGLMLDKSKGLVLGPELVTNGGFSSGTTGWTLQGTATISGGVAVINSSSSSDRLVSASTVLPAGKFVQLSFDLTVVSGAATFQDSIGGNVLTFSTAGRKTAVLFSATAVGIQFFRNSTAGSFNGTIDNISVRELPGNHATQPTATARPVLQIDGNGKHYLQFDGVDDFLVTNTITPNTDKAQVFAGVRSLTGGAYGALLEMSSNAETSPGTVLMSGNGNLSTYRVAFISRGTSTGPALANSTAFNPPVTLVQSGLGDISGDSAILRINGAQSASSTADQGTGNYLAYPLYIGSRAGTSQRFNGHLYSLIVRFGANLATDAITQTENWVNTKTGAY